MTTMQILIILCGLAAVLYGLVTSRQILSLDTGNDKMKEIDNESIISKLDEPILSIDVLFKFTKVSLINS